MSQLALKLSGGGERVGDSFVYTQIRMLKFIVPRYGSFASVGPVPDSKLSFRTDFAWRLGIVDLHPISQRIFPADILQQGLLDVEAQ